MGDDHVSAAKVWGYARDLLSIGVIPLLIWGIKLEVGNAQRDLRIEQLGKDIVRLEERIQKNSDIEDKVTALALKQATLEGKLDTANGRLDEIKALLRN
jgi:hypothetical protein